MDSFKTQTHISLKRKFSRSSVLRGSLAQAASSLRRKLWLAPLFTAIALAFGGRLLYQTIDASLQKKLAGELEAILNADLAALDLWLNVQCDVAQDRATNPELAAAVEALIDYAAQKPTGFELIQSPLQNRVRGLLDSSLKNKNFNGYILVAQDGRIISAFRDELIGKQSKLLYPNQDFIDETLAGETTVSPPLPSAALLPDRSGRLRAGVPTMFACAPVANRQSKTIAAICFRLPPEEGFAKILDVARFGSSGDTYAFDEEGLLLTSSRFDPELKSLGLLPDTAEAESILTLRLRDPLVDLTSGARSPAGVEKPLIPIVVEAAANRNGVNVTGFRDIRGVKVVAAWRWLPDYGMGVATQVDYAEAYETLGFVRYTLWGIFGLLILAALGMLAAVIYASRMSYALKVAVVESSKLGQYVLEEKLGEGGMGVVYRARHAMLRRPTAVKMLLPSASDDDAVRRFEREVQLTSQLTHPNTIAIYDYGRTQEGVFYYAMEYLDGISLDSLVQRHGPQPEGRVIELLTQICGSLAEAHDQGLIHRDIKPANILLNQRGRQFDLVKVLDFGLVKSLDAGDDAALTQARTILGTPHFMSPEAILSPDNVDPRSDLYAVGAVGYFLLTGKFVFEGKSLMEICDQHLNREPAPPSIHTFLPISADLERIILGCLAKRREQRPADAEALGEMLQLCVAAGSWTRAAAEQWWSDRGTKPLSAKPRTPETHSYPETSRSGDTILLPADQTA